MSTSAIDPGQLRSLVIAPALAALGLASPAAEELLLGTALQETGGGHWLHQLGAGPAIGLYQMEPATHDDIWKSFLASHAELAAKVTSLTVPGLSKLAQLAGNLYYATAMTRIFYDRVPEPLPAAGDIAAQAAYYKAHYNTPLGAATTAQYLENWHKAFA